MSGAIELERKNGVFAAIWIDGRQIEVMILWLSKTHIELIIKDPLSLSEGKRSALLVRNFVSFPMRVQSIFGYHAVLRFDQSLHQSIVDQVAGQLVDCGLAATQDELEERAIPFPVPSDLEAPFERYEAV
ncbi:MAG: hypothetical protein AAGK01_07745, partial [Pseudomonadota bacterium]